MSNVRWARSRFLTSKGLGRLPYAVLVRPGQCHAQIHPSALRASVVKPLSAAGISKDLTHKSMELDESSPLPVVENDRAAPFQSSSSGDWTSSSKPLSVT